MAENIEKPKTLAVEVIPESPEGLREAIGEAEAIMAEEVQELASSGHSLRDIVRTYWEMNQVEGRTRLDYLQSKTDIEDATFLTSIAGFVAMLPQDPDKLLDMGIDTVTMTAAIFVIGHLINEFRGYDYDELIESKAKKIAEAKRKWQSIWKQGLE